MRKRTGTSLFFILAALAIIGGALALRAKAAPEAARLLPECDAIVYANLKPLRAATHFDRNPVARTPEFQQFIDATGIVPERDLDAAAFALHRMPDPTGPNGPVAYSEVFQGHFDSTRLARYLPTIATGKESYAGHDIFTIPVGDKPNIRLLRVTQLDAGTIAVSNAPTPEQVHAMLDRHRAATTLFSSPTLLSGLYSEVPSLSSAWAIGQIALPFAENGTLSLAGLSLPLPQDTTFIASVRYLGSIHLRVEAVAATDNDAAQTARTLASILSLVRTMELSQTNNHADAQTRQMLDSFKIESAKDRVVLTANIPQELLRHLSAPDNQAPPSLPPASH